MGAKGHQQRLNTSQGGRGMASRARMVNVLRADQAQMGVVGSTLGSNNNSAIPISTAAFAESSEE